MNPSDLLTQTSQARPQNAPQNSPISAPHTAHPLHTLQTVRLHDMKPQSWRNGGGSTCELLTWPAGPQWLCRISVARIEQGGPFSAFPGIERWIAVVQGAGVVLHFGKRRSLLSMGSEPLQFDGAEAPRCELLEGGSQDLNLMTQSAAGRGAMFKAQLNADWTSSAPVRALYTARDVQLQIDKQPGQQLQAHSLVFCEQAAHQRWRLKATPSALLDPPGAWWMEFKPHSE